MHVLSTVFRVVVQIAIVIVVPGGLPAVLIYQYRRLQKRRQAAMTADTQSNSPTATESPAETVPTSPRN